MRICIVGIMVIPDEHLQASLDMIRPSYAHVLRPETEVVLKSPQVALRGGSVTDPDNPYFAMLNKRPVVEAFIEAEREGFDAAIVQCFGDPGVREARAVVDMPIFGPGESSMHFACQLGRKFAIVGANIPGQLAQLSDQVKAAGLEGRLIPNGIRFGSVFAKAWDGWCANPQSAVDDVIEVATGCVRDGADSVILGCAGIGPLCSTQGFAKLTVDGQTIPIIDPVTIAMKTAEMAADIKKGMGLPIPARATNFVLPSKQDWARVRSDFGLPV
ncbi:MAG: aspartate/glutamate racemase family protein [Candidatus Binatia bacterium]